MKRSTILGITFGIVFLSSMTVHPAYALTPPDYSGHVIVGIMLGTSVIAALITLYISMKILRRVKRQEKLPEKYKHITFGIAIATFCVTLYVMQYVGIS